MKKTINIALLLCFLLTVISSTTTYAKIEPPQPKPAGPAPQPGLPINGGILYLLISGVAYGVFVLKNKKD